MKHPFRTRTALASSAIALVSPLAVVAAPIAAPASGITSQTAPATADARLARASRPKVGTYEGTYGPKGRKTAFSLDVVKRNGRLSVVRAVAFYRCSGQTDPRVVYSSFPRLKVRNGRFGKDSIIDIRGRFASRSTVVGTANPAPGLLGCSGRSHPFKARFAGKSVARGESFAGADAAGAPVTFSLEAGGKVLDDLTVDRRLSCGSASYNELFSFDRSLVRQDGSASGSLVDTFYPATFSYSLAIGASGAVTGTYRVSGAACDTGDVAFTAAAVG